MFDRMHDVVDMGNGQTYIGKWLNNQPHGYGSHTWPDGRQYSGSWVNGSQSGYGVLTLTDGLQYEGAFKDGELEGSAMLTMISGDKYTGKFVNFTLNGRYEHEDEFGRTTAELWIDDQFERNLTGDECMLSY